MAARAGSLGAISAPETASSTKLQAGSKLLTKSSWDPGVLTSTRRVAVRGQLPRGDTAHLRQCSRCAPRRQSGWAQGGDTTHRTPWRVRWPSTWSPALLGPGKGTECRPKCVPLWSTREPEAEWLRPGKCTQARALFRQFPCRVTWSLSGVDGESTHAMSRVKSSVTQTP